MAEPVKCASCSVVLTVQMVELYILYDFQNTEMCHVIATFALCMMEYDQAQQKKTTLKPFSFMKQKTSLNT